MNPSTAGSGAWEVYAYVNNVFEVEYKVYTFVFSSLFGFNQQAAGLLTGLGDDHDPVAGSVAGPLDAEVAAEAE